MAGLSRLPRDRRRARLFGDCPQAARNVLPAPAAAPCPCHHPPPPRKMTAALHLLTRWLFRSHACPTVHTHSPPPKLRARPARSAPLPLPTHMRLAAVLLTAATAVVAAAPRAASDGGRTAPGCRVTVSSLTLAAWTPARQAALEPSPTKVPTVIRGLVDMYVYATDGEIQVREAGGEGGRGRGRGAETHNVHTLTPPPLPFSLARLHPGGRPPRRHHP